MIQLRLVTDAVIALLTSGLNVPVGDGEAPLANDGTLLPIEAGYVTVFRVPTNRFVGSEIAGTTGAMQWVRFEAMTSGVQRDQVEGLADMVSALVFARNAAGGFTNVLSVSNHTVIDRRPGGEVPLEVMGSTMGGTLFDLLVHRSG